MHAADWDADGDLDLIVGDIGGNLHLVPNEGTAKKWEFGKHRALMAGGEPAKVSGDAGPFVADWEGDGYPDLIVGAGDGSVTLFRDSGERRETGVVLLAPGRILVPPCGQPAKGADPVRPAMRAKVCVADWNGDGRLDLLVGDFAPGEGRKYHGWVWLYARKAPSKAAAAK